MTELVVLWFPYERQGWCAVRASWQREQRARSALRFRAVERVCQRAALACAHLAQACCKGCGAIASVLFQKNIASCRYGWCGPPLWPVARLPASTAGYT